MPDMVSDRLLSLLQDHSSGLLLFDTAGTCRYANAAACTAFRCPEPVGLPLDQLCGEFPMLQLACQRCLSGNLSAFQLSEGAYWFSANANTEGLLLMVSDAVAKKIAREVHDSTGPLLATLRLLFGQLTLAADASLRHLLDPMDALLKELEAELRDIYRSLDNTPGGLPSALLRLRELLQPAVPTRLLFVVPEYPLFLPEGDTHALYRMAQELLNNAIRHAQATCITLQLLDHEQSIVLMVEDDGRGFDPGGLTLRGLQQVRSRVSALGGTFLLDTLPEKGTTVTIEIPF